jgi:hypothetical protein
LGLPRVRLTPWFNRTLQTEWAYARPWISKDERTAALDGWLSH